MVLALLEREFTYNYIGTGGVGIKCETNAANEIKDVSVTGNKVFGTQYGLAAHKNTKKWVLSNNHFYGSGDSESVGVVIGDSSNGYFTIMGNFFENFNTIKLHPSGKSIIYVYNQEL